MKPLKVGPVVEMSWVLVDVGCQNLSRSVCSKAVGGWSSCVWDLWTTSVYCHFGYRIFSFHTYITILLLKNAHQSSEMLGNAKYVGPKAVGRWNSCVWDLWPTSVYYHFGYRVFSFDIYNTILLLNNAYQSSEILGNAKSVGPKAVGGWSSYVWDLWTTLVYCHFCYRVFSFDVYITILLVNNTHQS